MNKVMLVPLDPVHDIGLKMVAKGLEKAGHHTILLPPDLTLEEMLHQALAQSDLDAILISRTLGYGVPELMGRLIDLADASGLRNNVKMAIGGMAIKPELGAELGFDAAFGPGTSVEEVVSFVEGKEYRPGADKARKIKADMTAGYDYRYKNMSIAAKLDFISEQIIDWAKKRTSPGVQRAKLRDELWDASRWRSRHGDGELYEHYPTLCGEVPRKYYETGELHPKTRRFTREEVDSLEHYIAAVKSQLSADSIQHSRKKPLVFVQYGTGCPFMDIAHISASEAWGTDGVVHFDPSWGARTEGLMDGFLTHQEDGTVITPANLNRIKSGLEDSTLWQVRAHRGLNTPETVVLAGKLGADLTKINFCYGALGAGTDPERMVVDAYHSMLYAKKYNLPFDVVTNEELCGVPAYKAFAGMLIVADVALKLGARPVLQPLFAFSPEAMVEKHMEDNYVDFNAAKIYALRDILNAPIWPGAPIGFLTQSEDRVQSAMTTTLHACLALSLGVDAISIASSDEAYSGGPISAQARIDTLRAVKEGFRFFGQTGISPGAKANMHAEQIVEGIGGVLDKVIACGDIVTAMHQGLLGSREDGAYPGRAGRDTVRALS